MGTTLNVDTELRTVECSCGGVYAITESHRAHCQEQGESWTCPYCRTGWGFRGKGINARLKRELADAEREADLQRRFKEQAEAREERAKNQARGQKAANTRLKNRVAKGACPCCNRYFKNLHRHIQTQHPNYAEPANA